MRHILRTVNALPSLLLPMLLRAAEQSTEPANTGISSAAAWLMVGVVAAVMIGFIWRNARRNGE